MKGILLTLSLLSWGIIVYGSALEVEIFDSSHGLNMEKLKQVRRLVATTLVNGHAVSISRQDYGQNLGERLCVTFESAAIDSHKDRGLIKKLEALNAEDGTPYSGVTSRSVENCP